MNKRTLTLCAVLALAVASADAFASRARNLVWGTGDAGAILGTSGDNGSFYVDDAYNMFYNPSYIMNNGEWATIEKSNAAAGEPMGGFTTKVAGFGLGFFMNRASANPNSVGTTERPIEVLAGGEFSGVKVGLGGAFTSGVNKTNDTTDMDITLRAGAQVMGIEPFVAFKIIGKNDQAGATADDTSSFMAFGAKYRFGEWTPYVAYATGAQKDGTTSVSTKVANNFGLGIGRSTKLGQGANLQYAIGWWKTKNAAAAIQEDINRVYVPINVSASADVTGWLTLRGGLEYFLVAMNGNGSLDQATANNSAPVTGRVGASINVGSVSFDWAVGNAAVNTENLDSRTFDFSNSLFTAASLTYRM